MLLLLLSTALGAQAAPTPASAPLSPAEAGAASQLARDWGVSIVEADARLARQKSIEDFIAAAQKRNPVTYGGAFIDQAGEGNLIVNETSPVSLTDLIAHFHLAGHVQERSARHSYASLVSLTGRVVALAKPQAAQLGAVTTFVDESRNAVRVRMMPTSPDPGTRAAFVSAIGGLGEDIVVTPDNQPMTLDAALCDFRSCPLPCVEE